MNRKIFIKATLLFVLLVAIFGIASVASACPTCKDGVAANDPEHVGMVKGYFYSILLMMFTPYVVICCFGLYMWRQVKLARLKRATEPAASNSVAEDRVRAQSVTPAINRTAPNPQELVEV